jgi:Cu-Zn family superoxide dismutase
MKKLLLPIALLSALPFSVQAEELRNAQAMLLPLGDSTVGGLIKFKEVKEGGVQIIGQVTGLKKSSNHGFHIHEFGDCTTVDGTSAGGHFKVGDSHHGAPNSLQKHVGDLGNIKSDVAGMSIINTADKGLSMSGANSILGRGVIIHAGEDDLKTDPAGNSGARIACGVIGLVK